MKASRVNLSDLPNKGETITITCLTEKDAEILICAGGRLSSNDNANELTGDNMSEICQGCRKAAMYTVKIADMIVCEECIDKAKEKVSFKSWMAQVDRATIEQSGVSVYDLPDVLFRDYFNEGLTAEEVAEIAIEEAGWDE